VRAAVVVWETMAKRVLVAEAKRRVKKVLERTPFKPSPTIKQPRSMKDRQQLWVLSGLKHLRAPVVFWISYQYMFVSNLLLKVWCTKVKETIGDIHMFVSGTPLILRSWRHL